MKEKVKNGNFGSSIEEDCNSIFNPRKKGKKNVFDMSKAEEYFRSFDEREEEYSPQEFEELVQKAQGLAVCLLAWLCYQARTNSSEEEYHPGKEIKELESLCSTDQTWRKEALLVGLLKSLLDRFSIAAVGKAGVISFLNWLIQKGLLLPSDRNAPLRFLGWGYSLPNYSHNGIVEFQSLFKTLEEKVKISVRNETERFMKEQLRRYNPVHLSDKEGRRQFEEGKPGYYLGEITSCKVVLPGGVVKYLGSAIVLVAITNHPFKEDIKIVRPIGAVGSAKEKFEIAKIRNLYVLHHTIFDQFCIGRIENLSEMDSKLIRKIHQFIRRALGLSITQESDRSQTTVGDPDADSPSISVD